MEAAKHRVFTITSTEHTLYPWCFHWSEWRDHFEEFCLEFQLSPEEVEIAQSGLNDAIRLHHADKTLHARELNVQVLECLKNDDSDLAKCAVELPLAPLVVEQSVDAVELCSNAHKRPKEHIPSETTTTNKKPISWFRRMMVCGCSRRSYEIA